MNDLGMALGWLALQVTFVLIPALILQARASRRGPIAGAWVASWSLALVLVLGLLSVLPTSMDSPDRPTETATALPITTESPTAANRAGTAVVPTVVDPRGASGLSLGAFRARWSQWRSTAIAPVSRFRPWGRALAIVALTASAFGLVRLLVGLWAVAHCRRRGRRVEDPALLGLLDELRGAMGCVRPVEVREVADLATPATAGWRRPMVLLPDDWRTWDSDERRAVIAHEMAHIVRSDYASGLLARLAVVLHAAHPLVRWMAAQLHLQQELAADALGAEFAGGRACYLLALSRLALKQDGRSPSWPARAFLPTRGTLIRRIKMLRNVNETELASKRWSRSRKLATALGLVGLTLGAASLQRPVRAGDEKPAPVSSSTAHVAPAVEVEPFAVEYIPDGMPGVIGLRPAALARRIGVEKTNSMIEKVLGGGLPKLAKYLGVDMSQAGFIKLGIEDIESVTFGFKFGYQKNGQKNENEEKLQTIECSTCTIKTVDAFDWPKFFRQWTMPLEEIREPKGVYYKPSNAGATELFMGAAFFQPDRRTLIFEYEPRIKTLIANGPPQAPVHLRGADWDRVSRNMVAIAINNQAGAFAKGFDPNSEDDKAILPFFKGVESWFVGVPDEDKLSYHASLNCSKPEDRESFLKAFATELNKLREQLKPQGVGPNLLAVVSNLDPGLRMYRSLVEKVSIDTREKSLAIVAEDFGKFTDLPAILKKLLDNTIIEEDDDVKTVKPEAKPTKP